MQRRTLPDVRDGRFPGALSFLRGQQSFSLSRNFSSFMEPKGSLPRSQDPATGLHPEPEESSPQPHILSLSKFIFISYSYIQLGISCCLHFKYSDENFVCLSHVLSNVTCLATLILPDHPHFWCRLHVMTFLVTSVLCRCISTF
jgi:hypothetical protein